MYRPSTAPRTTFAASLAGVWLAACSTPDDPPSPLVFDLRQVETTFKEVVQCKHSHEHDLRHVRIFADDQSAGLFETCVLNAKTEVCPAETFPEGALFVKYEYEREGCVDEDLVSYTASLKLEPGSYPLGRDWQWQRTTKELELVEDGAPASCIGCHINHCSYPHGFDLRCLPD